jgi:hypothetical protein
MARPKVSNKKSRGRSASFQAEHANELKTPSKVRNDGGQSHLFASNDQAQNSGLGTPFSFSETADTVNDDRDTPGTSATKSQWNPTAWLRKTKRRIQIVVSPVTNLKVVVVASKLVGLGLSRRALGNAAALVLGWAAWESTLYTAATKLNTADNLTTAEVAAKNFQRLDFSDMTRWIPLVQVAVFTTYFLQPVYHSTLLRNTAKTVSLFAAVVMLRDTPVNSRLFVAARLTLPVVSGSSTHHLDAVMVAYEPDACQKFTSVVRGWSAIPSLLPDFEARSYLYNLVAGTNAGGPADQTDQSALPNLPQSKLQTSARGVRFDMMPNACVPFWTTHPYIFVVSESTIKMGLAASLVGNQEVPIGFPLNASLYGIVPGNEFSPESTSKFMANYGLRLAPRHVALPTNITHADVNELGRISNLIKGEIERAIVAQVQHDLELHLKATGTAIPIDKILPSLLRPTEGITEDTVVGTWLDSSEVAYVPLAHDHPVFGFIEQILRADPTIAKINHLLNETSVVVGESIAFSGEQEQQVAAVRLIIKGMLPYFADRFDRIRAWAKTGSVELDRMTNAQITPDGQPPPTTTTAITRSGETTYQLAPDVIRNATILVLDSYNSIVAKDLAHPLMQIFTRRSAFENANTQLTPFKLDHEESLRHRQNILTRAENLRTYIQKHFPKQKNSQHVGVPVGFLWVYLASLLGEIVFTLVNLGRDEIQAIRENNKRMDEKLITMGHQHKDSERKHMESAHKLQALYQKSQEQEDLLNHLSASGKKLHRADAHRSAFQRSADDAIVRKIDLSCISVDDHENGAPA